MSRNCWIIGYMALICTWQVQARVEQSSIERGKTLATVCAACHGEGGRSKMENMPSLASQNEKYLIRQMQHYKEGAPNKNTGRYNAVMTPLMINMSEQDMRDIAAYYASEPAELVGSDSELLAKGEQLYQGGDSKRGITACKGCHGPIGNGNAQAGFPALSGQRPEYVDAQLKAYRDRERHNDTNEIMRDIAAELTDKDIEALANYIAGLYGNS